MNAAALNYKSLPVSQRLQLVEKIWDSIADEAPEEVGLSAAQVDEVNRRAKEHLADPESAVPWSEDRRQLFGASS